MRDLAEAMAADGHAVRLLTGEFDSPILTLGTVPVHPLTVPFIRSDPTATSIVPDTALAHISHAAAVYREVLRLHVEDRPIDVVVAPLWCSEGVVCMLDERFPTVVSCMTSLRTLTEINPGWRGPPDLQQQLALERAMMRRSRYQHGLSRSVLSKCGRDYGLSSHAAAVVGRGLRDRRGHAAGRVTGNSTPKVLFVGRLEHRKGVDTLLAATRVLVDEGLQIDVTIAGPNADPSYRAAFEREAALDPALSAAVHFTGAVSEEQLHELLAETDMVCLPSRYESHGVVLIEAMMYAKPIVTCSAGGIGEVVEAGRNALLTPPEDAAALADSLRRLCQDPSLRQRMGVHGRMTYERRFSATIVARQMEAFLGDVVRAHRPASDSPRPVREGLAVVLQEVLGADSAHAWELAAELLDPPRSILRPLSRIAQSRRLILGEIGDPPDLTVVRASVTRADDLVAAGTRLLLAGRDYREIDLAELMRSHGHTLLLAGGDGFSHPDPGVMARALAAAGTRFERTIVLPSSFDASDDGVSVALARTSATVFASETESYRMIAPLCDSRLAHGCAFYFDFGAYRRQGAGTLNAFRVDHAVRRSRPLPPGNVDLSVTAPDLAAWLEAIAVHDLVRTDDPHVMIAAALMGKRVEYGPSGDHQLDAIAQYALADYPVTRIPEIVNPRSVSQAHLRASTAEADVTRERLMADLRRRQALAEGEQAIRARLEGERAAWETKLRGLEQALADQTDTLAFLQQRHETLGRIERGRWWRLRGRLAPLFRLSLWLRGLGPR